MRSFRPKYSTENEEMEVALFEMEIGTMRYGEFADDMLGRRYLRFTKFIDCFGSAYSSFTSSSNRGFVASLEVGKWSCLGIYLLLESCTIVSLPLAYFQCYLDNGILESWKKLGRG